MDIQLCDLQSKLIEMLEWFDAFCRENGLRYFALGGTMLGAARHQGMIPWDDDIDVGLPRRDYDRLCELLQNAEGRYVLETPFSGADDYCYSFAKLYDTTTTMIEYKRVPVKRGVYLDLFPLDGMGNDLTQAVKHFNRIRKVYNLHLLRTAGWRKGRSFRKNMAVMLMRCVPRFLLNERKLVAQIHEMCRQVDYDSSTYIGNVFGAWGQKEIVPIACLGEPVRYSFENVEICGVKDYDTYLTCVYGDWRQLPPEEKRVSHHTFSACDLNRSFLEDHTKR